MAARTEARKFGSFSLTDTNGIAIESCRARLLHRASFEGRLKADGAIVTKDRLEGVEVALAGTISGTSDTGQIRDRIDALLQAITNGDDHLQLYSDRRILCRLLGDVDLALVSGSAGLVYRFGAQFRSRWPTWENPTQSSIAFTPTGAGPHTLVLGSNAATAPTFPRITIGNAGAGFSDKQITLTLINTGQQLQLTGLGMGGGDQIVLDLREGALGDGLSAPITPYSIEGIWWGLVPGVSNTLEMAHNVGAGASWNVSVTWHEQYWSL
ncbi:MAG: hypothetical protein IT458_05065 [Planctomycetes bacterium]|nr:hypothetical protein [Planctomycetota bacterium]